MRLSLVKLRSSQRLGYFQESNGCSLWPGQGALETEKLHCLYCFLFYRWFVILVLKEFKPHYRHKAKDSLGFSCFMFFGCIRTQTKQKAPERLLCLPWSFSPAILSLALNSTCDIFGKSYNAKVYTGGRREGRKGKKKKGKERNIIQGVTFSSTTFLMKTIGKNYHAKWSIIPDTTMFYMNEEFLVLSSVRSK